MTAERIIVSFRPARAHFAAFMGLFLLLLLCPPEARAEIAIRQFWFDFETGGPAAQDLEIVSLSDETQYVSVQLYEMRNPPGPDQKMVPVRDLRQSDVIVTPSKLVLPPRASKFVRLLKRRHPSDRDRIYQVRVAPVVAGVKTEGAGAGVHLVVGYHANIIMRPTEMKPDYKLTRSGRQLRFENTGNTFIKLVNVQQCPGGPSTCKDVPGDDLYAGEVWTGTLPGDGGVKLLLQIGEDYKTETR